MEDMILVSHVPRGGKSMILASSVHHKISIIEDTENPRIDYYSLTKGVVNS
jgi:hypothetical protein